MRTTPGHLLTLAPRAGQSAFNLPKNLLQNTKKNEEKKNNYEKWKYVM